MPVLKGTIQRRDIGEGRANGTVEYGVYFGVGLIDIDEIKGFAIVVAEEEQILGPGSPILPGELDELTWILADLFVRIENDIDIGIERSAFPIGPTRPMPQFGWECAHDFSIWGRQDDPQRVLQSLEFRIGHGSNP